MSKKSKFHPIRNVFKKSMLKSGQEQGYIVSKKILCHFELEPELIDVFTKKQKEHLFHKFYETPSIKPAREKTVPRQYIRNINTAIFQFMKSKFWGNPENRLSYMDLATYGLSFLSSIEYDFQNNLYAADTPQYEATRRICEKFDRDEVMNTAFKEVLDEVWYLTRSYSRFNYRMYGFSFDCDRKQMGYGFHYRLSIKLTAQECEMKAFNHNNVYRKAFRMFNTDNGLYLPRPVRIPQNLIYHDDASEDRKFDVYIQSHAINRFKERLDILEPTQQNLLLQYAFTKGLQFECFDKREMFVCLFEDERRVGYFTFFVRGNDLVVNTFLPLVSHYAPEGKKLQKILSISKDEFLYLGMDKLSFYLDVDFEQIPELKQALIEADIWQTKLILDRLIIHEYLDDDDAAHVAKKTAFVKNFFNKQAKSP
jgi:hypothetical protein